MTTAELTDAELAALTKAIGNCYVPSAETSDAERLDVLVRASALLLAEVMRLRSVVVAEREGAQTVRGVIRDRQHAQGAAARANVR